jgi:type II secretory pathway component PulF
VQACDAKGASLTRVIEGEDAREVRATAQSQGLFVVSVKAQKGSGDASPDGPVPRRVRGASKKLTQFARELSVLVGTGTPIADSLRAVERQASEENWRRVIGAVRESVEEGVSLSSALSQHPGVFDQVFCSLIGAGESSGRLDDMLKRLAMIKRRERKAKSLMIGSATYPAVLIVVAGGVMIAMVLFVIPRFAGLFETLNAPLPWTTELLLTMSNGFKQWWWALLLSIAAGVAGVLMAARNPGMQRRADLLLCRVPVLGSMAQGFTVARTLRMMGVLLDAKVSMLEAIGLVRKSVRRPLYAEWADHATELVTRGEALSGSFEDPMLFTPSIREAVSNAERTGRLAPVLVDLSDFMDDENEAMARTFSNLLEPVIMIGLGVVVAFVALSMFLPLFDLTASAGAH